MEDEIHFTYTEDKATQHTAGTIGGLFVQNCNHGSVRKTTSLFLSLANDSYKNKKNALSWQYQHLDAVLKSGAGFVLKTSDGEFCPTHIGGLFQNGQFVWFKTKV